MQARAAVTEDSDDDTAPPNGFDEILNEVCEEAGYESEETDKKAGLASFEGLDAEAWMLDTRQYWQMHFALCMLTLKFL